MNLETKTARARLEPRWKPYWLRLNSGLSLGYRRTVAGAGTWSKRESDGKRSNNIARIAFADDVERANGTTVLSFAQARDAVLKLSRGETPDAKPATVTTLGEAIEDYKAGLTARRAGLDNHTRLVANVKPVMRKRPVALLNAAELRQWRDALAKTLAPASVNRTITIMKAVLNLAADNDEKLTRRAWEIGLESLPEATVARNVVLPEKVIRAVIAAARDDSVEFGLLVETLAVTGARVSQIARCTVADLLDGDRLAIPSSAKGTRKRQSRTPVPVPPELATRLRAAAAARKAALSDPLLVKPAGTPWRKSDHSRLFERAAEAAGLADGAATSYALRHSHITAQLLDGLPIQVVARLHDTSSAMIERHYAEAIAHHADEMVRRSMMRVDPPVATVVQIGEGRA